MTIKLFTGLAGLAAGLLAPLACLAQDAPRYRPPADTVWMERVNPFTMYWVHGADTVGGPVHAHSVEAQAWRAAGPRLEVVTRQSRLDLQRTVKIDTTQLMPDGTVAGIGGRPPSISETIDFTLHLPSTALAPGVAWADSVHADSAGVHGARVYEVRRRLRVARLVDSLGTRVAEVRAEGTVRYRDAFVIDSASGRYAWLDVTGPVEETYWFDVARGQLVGRRWAMDLRGSGGIPNGNGGMDSVPAGLRSREWEHAVSATRARLLTRALPGADTSFTVAPGPVLLHTVERSTTRVRSAMARFDGLVGTAETEFTGGRFASYKAVWTDTAAVATVHNIRVDGGRLRVTGGGAPELLAIPGDAWGIADYAMEEHLVPMLMALPGDRQPHPIHVYRPTAAHWDHGTATVVRREGVALVTLQMEGDTARSLMLITDDGDYLYAVATGLQDSERVPPVGSARRARLEAILARIREPGRTSAAPGARGASPEPIAAAAVASVALDTDDADYRRGAARR